MVFGVFCRDKSLNRSRAGCLTEDIEVCPELYCQAINFWRFVLNVERDIIQLIGVVTLRVYAPMHMTLPQPLNVF